MKRSRYTAALWAGAVMCAWVTAGHAQSIDLAQFRQLRSEAVAAANAGDLDAASQKLEAAAALNPGHPGILLMRARVAAAAGQQAEAVGFLERFAGFGLHADLVADPAFAEAQTWLGFTDVVERVALNRRPAGAPVELFRDGSLHLFEGLAWWKARDRLLVSSIRNRTVLQLLPDGELAPYLTEPEALGVFGLAIDEDSDRLWAAASGAAEAAGLLDADKGRSALIEIELSSGRVLRRHSPPAARRRNFGDVAVGPGGMVAVSDSTNGDVFLLRRGAAELETLSPPGTFGSPQGMVFSGDGTALIIADYSATLYRIDLATGAVQPLALPPGETLIAIDGLSAAPDGAIWAVQNGVSPNRLLRLELAADWRSVERVSVAMANLPDMDQPSGVTVSDRGIVLIQQSQWGVFDSAGLPQPGQVQDAVISVLETIGHH